MDSQEKVQGRRRLKLYAVAAIILASAASCVAGVSSFFGEDRIPVQRLVAYKAEPVTRLEVNATVISIDPVRNLMKIELVFQPKGDVIEITDDNMTRDVHLVTNSVQGAAEAIFKTHHQAHPIEVTLSLQDGDIALYPIDKYYAELQLDAFILKSGDAGEMPLPVAVNFVAHNHALHVDANVRAGSNESELNIQLRLQRPVAVQGFAWFINGLMVMLAVSAAIVVFNVAYRGKRLEPNLLVWMSALLFVLPSMRNILPGVPPLGAFTDFLVFFWVEGALALCLFIMVLTWFGRVPEK